MISWVGREPLILRVLSWPRCDAALTDETVALERERSRRRLQAKDFCLRRFCLAVLIVVNLLMIPGYYDVALRDFGLALAALALARLSRAVEPWQCK